MPTTRNPEPGPLPWARRTSLDAAGGVSVALTDANGGVVCLMKGPRKDANADLILELMKGRDHG